VKDFILPKYNFKTRLVSGKKQIFDPVRKKYVYLTKEEWVRQNIIQFLIIEKFYPVSLIRVEFNLKFNTLSKRADIVCFDKNGSVMLLVECKSPEIQLNQNVFDQIAIYNLSFKSKFLLVTNGLNYFCCEMNYSLKKYSFLSEIPSFA
tara:strand:- start:186 stop:629 length:444 start_codon:yes stop_codon:yes gene_type:complete